MSDPRDVRSAFRERRRRSRIAQGILLLCALVVMAGADRASGTVWGVGAAVLKPLTIGLLALGVFAVYSWRCPGCGHLFVKEWNPSRCRGCGAQLQ